MRNISYTKSDYYGSNVIWFIGQITKIIDRATVRVCAFGIHDIGDPRDFPSEDDFPIASVVYPTTGAQAGSGSLTHNLEIGSWVVGFFADAEDLQQPIVIGSLGAGMGSGSAIRSGKHRVYYNGEITDTPNIALGVPDDPGTSFSIIKGRNNKEKTITFLSSKLWALGIRDRNKIANMVSGFVGSLMTESSDCDPTATKPAGATVIVGKVAHGIAQWRGSRLEKLLGAPWYGERNLDRQLEFLWWELQNDEKVAYSRWLNSSDLKSATVAAATFERGEDVKTRPPGELVNFNHPVWGGSNGRYSYAIRIRAEYNFEPMFNDISGNYSAVGDA